MYHLDPVEDAARYGDALEAREELARKEHEANRAYLIEMLLKDSEHDVGYVSRWSGRKSYTASQHAIDQIEASAELRRDLFKLIAACEKSPDHLLRLQAQSILARIGDAYADDQVDA